ncbi:hypothetical protein BD410DRAFT_45009 [Rickenella mellea]|uniref:Uncharacterized protein n=1 Tax=Rickenella mellea TaxID=50990 RepID=A0A4R5XFD1_9AGAM|nr:hypothetical protein BD410DRAFT_45009 [Rickenella mellea]
MTTYSGSGVSVSWRHDGHHRTRPSAIHGWLTKLRGVLTFNSRTIRRGNREIGDARAYHEAKRISRQSRGHHRGFFSMFGSRRHHGEPVVVSSGSGRRRHRHHRFMHFHHRSPPWHHGAHLRFWGWLTRNRRHVENGLIMREVAWKDREKERRRRRRRLRHDGADIRTGAALKRMESRR